MTALTTDARAAVALALASVSANIYDTVPKVPTPPAVVIANDNPWQVPAVIGGRLRVEHHLRVMCVVRDSQDNLPQLESLVEDVLVALPAGAIVSEVTAPASLDNGPQGSVLAAEIRITLHLKES